MWLNRDFLLLLLLCLIKCLFLVDCVKIHKHFSKHGLKFMKTQGIGGHHVRRNASSTNNNNNHNNNNVGLWPSVFNLATKAVISVNATCGEGGREEFCKISDSGKGKCGVCDNFSTEPGRRHPIHNAIDGTNKWWQSPALIYGDEFEYVTITIDLKQVYQIAYVTIKSANSPRPGTWILERSIDGTTYHPWQYFARNDKECLERFGVAPTKGKPHFYTDTEVICTSYYSKLTPLENGESHTSLIYGRPGANETSPELLEFTKARFVRIRLIGLRGAIEPLPKWLSQDLWREKRLYYSIKDISIGGQCVCNGHADTCRHNVASGHPECECSHHTCGPNCERCCPMYNQRPWGAGSSRDARRCLPCNCHGHATTCHYDETTDRAGLSTDINGNHQGGGVCDNCTAFTTGINCEKCLPGYYRPEHVTPDAREPCLKCDCDPIGSELGCVQEGPNSGFCQCNLGYSGRRCDTCALGYRGYPRCELCPCDSKGVTELGDCEGDCTCKKNVEGKYCDRCKSGYFALRGDNLEGCAPCFCSSVTTLCESAVIKPRHIKIKNEWLITDLRVSKIVKPAWDDRGLYSIGNYEMPGFESLYWLAPEEYLGNLLQAYSSNFIFKIHWVVMRGDTSGKPTIGPNLIIIGTNNMKIAYGNEFFSTSNMTFNIKLQENGWYHVPHDVKDIVTSIMRNRRTDYKGAPVSRQQFLSVLTDVKHVLLRATFHTDQIEGLFEEAVLNFGQDVDENESYSSVEKCSCPSGYSGLSCESCSFGYVRITTNSTNSWSVQESFCGKCDCNGHSETCNPDTGECFCEHNTIGEQCERCSPGYYGNPLHGTLDDCKKCACPLEVDTNNFSPSCQLDYYADDEKDEGGYVCTQCPKGYTGDHCEICDDGYYGNPLEIGNSCQSCGCNGGPCDRVTGQCLSCKGNTEGFKCEKCKSGHYGDASKSDCIPCQCDHLGSLSKECDNQSGQCLCKEKFTGRTCDKCEVGYGNVTAFCTKCSCNSIGSLTEVCDPHSGLCNCRPGVEGFHCDACQSFYYGFSKEGCKECSCDPDGSAFLTCSPEGQCRCRPHFTGKKCDTCEDKFWREDRKTCKPCNCDERGSTSHVCNKSSGTCQCKPGIGDRRCDKCLPNFYGTVQTGCKTCDPCKKDGHICDQNNGKCVCPPLTIGEKCNKCAPNSWGYEPGLGCKACDCSLKGTHKNCDQNTGICTCKPGYEGLKCNSCAIGYYGYPNCLECKCDPSGTSPASSSCNSITGHCKCKNNVEGPKCSKCKPGSFGLSKTNKDGCSKCFCFGRSKKCTEAPFKWKQNMHENLKESTNCVNTSKCIELPKEYLGDLTKSYGGNFYATVEDTPSRNFSVYLKGPLDIILVAHFRGEGVPIVINEDHWKVYKNRYYLLPSSPLIDHTLPCTSQRNCFLAILQNVTRITIEGSTPLSFQDVSLDTATSQNYGGGEPAKTIEKCDCPKEYTSLSCQDPNEGYFRHFPSRNDPKFSIYDKTAGISKPCDCKGRSKICNQTTGHCLNCEQHRNGPHCETCQEGYYENFGVCAPCSCPSADKHFATNCTPIANAPNEFFCNCKPGYIGAHCEECADGFFGKPLEPKGFCQKCACHLLGSINPTNCNKFSGTCVCKPGFTGETCNRCSSPREVIENGLCIPCDECSQNLFRQIDNLTEGIVSTSELFKNGLGPPWKLLNQNLEKFYLVSDGFEERLEKSERLIKKAKIDEYESIIRDIENSVTKKKRKVEENLTQIKGIRNNVEQIDEELNDIEDKVFNVVGNLSLFGKSKVDIKNAINEAQIILKNITEVSKHTKSDQAYRKIFEECNKVSGRIEEIFNNKTVNFSGETFTLKEFRRKLADLNELLNKTDNMNKLTMKKNSKIEKRLKIVQEKIDQINDKNEVGEKEVVGILRRIDDTREILLKITDVQDYLRENIEVINNEVGGEDQNVDVVGPNLTKLLDRVEQHVQELKAKVESLEDFKKNMFNYTVHSKNVDAVMSHKTVTKNIKKAYEDATAAQKILEKTSKTISDPSSGGDSLQDKSSIALGFSDRLEKRIRNILNKREDFIKTVTDLDYLKGYILDNGKFNNQLNLKLRNIEEEISKFNGDELKKIILDNRVSPDMVKLQERIKNIKFVDTHNFYKDYEKYKQLTTPEEINNLKSKIVKTRLDLEKYISSDREDLYEKFKIKHESILKTTQGLDNIKNKIKQLKSSIQFAKHEANAVDIPLELTNCTQFYKVDRQIFSSFKIVFKCSEKCTLFKYTNGKEDQIILKTENKKILLTISFQGNNTTQTLDYEESKLTTVKIEWTLGRVVFSMTAKDKEDKRVVHLGDGMELFVLDNGNEIEIGPSSGNGSCAQRAFLNGKVFGFWNFHSFEGNCKGCDKDRTAGSTETVFFDGKGYRVADGSGIELSDDIRTDQIKLGFFFRTYDENSLIFLGVAPEASNFIALILNEGHIVFYIKPIGYSKVITTKTTQTYNDGQLYILQVSLLLKAKTNLTISLKVDGENKNEEVPHHEVGLEGSGPNIILIKPKKVKYYIAGLPPTFISVNIPQELLSKPPFLGSLLPQNNLFKSAAKTISHGTTEFDNKNELFLDKAWFSGNGFLNVSIPLKDSSNFTLSFIFRTETKPKPNTSYFLMKFLHQDLVLFLKDENIILKMNQDEFNVTGLKPNDINIFKMEYNGKFIIFSLNGNTSDMDISLEGTVLQILMGKDIDTPGMMPFSGGISKMFVDDTAVNFGTKYFSKVEIGREKDLEQNNHTQDDMPTNHVKGMLNTEGCSNIGHFSTEPGAIKFGDKPESYVFIENLLWKKEYEIELSFRTFYPNGVLLVSAGPQDHYNLLEIKEGKVQLHFKGKKLRKTVSFSEKINNGQWHNIRMVHKGVKKKRKVTIYLDNVGKKPVKPKNNVKGNVYVGGVPSAQFTPNKELADNILAFRGCMKDIKINGKPQILVKTKKNLFHNIGQCFPKIEEGAFFNGDAHAIYKSDFEINKILELSFEFRTSEQNGILLSVSNAGNSPALSVELQNGAVVMTIDMGNGAISNVTNNLDSEFALCNNRWHNVTALYSSSELTVNVDGIRKSWVQSDVNSLMDEIGAPLYIGGIPGEAPVGTLKTRENFKGCIRKFSIEEKLMDWTDMEELNNVLLNSCPVT